MKQIIYNSKIHNWRIDTDGMLRVTARVLKEGVFPYLPEESPQGAYVASNGYVYQYIPASEFTEEALQSLEGKPVIIDSHEWRTAENAAKDGLTVGSVAGTPFVEDGYIVADFIVHDKDTVEAITNGTLVEVSSAYDGDCKVANGSFDNITYSAIQTNLRFNHVLLLPKGAGRCGETVGIVNKKSDKSEKGTMKVIQRQIGNKRVDYRFSNEEDAEKANEMADDEKCFNAEALNEAMETVKNLKNEVEEKTNALNEALKVVEEQKAEIEKLLSSEMQEELAKEAAAQLESEDAILDDAVENEVIEEDTKENIKNSFKNCKSFAERRKLVVMNAAGFSESDISDWKQEAVDAVFETLHKKALMNSKNKKTVKTTMGGASGRVENSLRTSPLKRIYERINNSKN